MLQPGADFEYTSAAGIRTLKGSMRGHFTMIGLETGKMFDAQIAPFALCPKPLAAAEAAESADTSVREAEIIQGESADTTGRDSDGREDGEGSARAGAGEGAAAAAQAAAARATAAAGKAKAGGPPLPPPSAAGDGGGSGAAESR